MAIMYATPATDSKDTPAESHPSDVEIAWELLVSKGYHAEIVDGRLIMSPAPSRRHSNTVEELSDQLYELKRRRGWHVYTGSAIHIPHIRNRRIPDLVVAPHNARWLDENQLVASGTLLVVEVVSPGKAARQDDFEIKPEEYARAGVPLYLIIDPEAATKTLTLLSAPKDDEYTERVNVKAGEPLHLPEPFDLTLGTATLFT